MPLPAFSGIAALLPALKSAYPCRKGRDSRIPIVYCDEYNIRAFGLEKLHPMDSCKFEKVVARLEEAGLLNRADLPSPELASDALLKNTHTDDFLKKLHSSKLYIAQVAELPLLVLLPLFVLRNRLLTPLRYHTYGTALAMALALEHGWAINLGGGAHHSRRDHGEGWCFYADISIGIRKLRSETQNRVQKFLYIDTDVHQGNGVERDAIYDEDQHLFILDVYNSGTPHNSPFYLRLSGLLDLWPQDTAAKIGIDISVELHCGTGDSRYLRELKKALEASKQQFKPDMIIYNAGTDVLKGDPLGRLNVTPAGVIERDQMVFQHAEDVGVPIMMMLSGGYTKYTHRVIADSILNLTQHFNLI